jgi:hypothetical protein
MIESIMSKKQNDYMDMRSNIKMSWNRGLPVDVTPEMAARWLKVSEGKNVRPVNKAGLQMLIESLKGGTHTTRTIRFHKDGWCCDGQHFLNAVSSTGLVAKNTFIEVGLEDVDVPHIDVGKLRSFTVTSRCAGVYATGGDSSLALVLKHGLDKVANSTSHDERRYLINLYREEIDLVNSSFSGARLKPVAMKKAFVDVYKEVKSNPEKLNRLVRFAKVFSIGDISGGSADQAAINLSRAIDKIPTADRKTRHEVYRLTIVAIDNFMKKKTAKKIYMDNTQKKIFSK